jgi:lipopolysaccharide export system protein LptC
MYLNLRTTLGVLVLAIAAFGSWWLAQGPRDLQSRPLSSGNPPPGYYLLEAKLHGTNTDGETLFEINAQSAQADADSQTMRLDGVRIDYQAGADVPWTLESDHGVAPMDQSYIKLSGSVTITAIGQHPEDSLIIRTADLTLQPESQLATTDSRVQIEMGKKKLNATGMVAYLGEERLELASNVNGKFNP